MPDSGGTPFLVIDPILAGQGPSSAHGTMAKPSCPGPVAVELRSQRRAALRRAQLVAALPRTEGWPRYTSDRWP